MTTDPTPIRAILFDIGDTLVRAAAPGTPVDQLHVDPIGSAVAELRALATRYKVGAVTDTATMSEADVRAALGDSGLSEVLEVIVTSSDVGVAKPDPGGLVRALSLLGVSAEAAVFVGDADVDQGAAGAAGVAFVRAGGDVSPGEAVRAFLAERDGAFAAAVALVGPLDEEARSAALAHHDILTKPRGSLGRLEEIGPWLAAVSGQAMPPRPHPAAVGVFGGDHGVVASGVTPWPQEVTGQMVANMVTGGAAVNVLARQMGASVTVVDVGVLTDLTAMLGDGFAPPATVDTPALVRANVAPGTADLSEGPAMTQAQARAALDVGARVAADLVAGGAAALVTGEMGIGNTTPSAAIISALTGRPAAEITGRGTGIDDDTLALKTDIIEGAVARLDGSQDPMRVLSEVGGLEIAALAGFIVGGASHRVPVVVDGVIADAALLMATALCPEALAFVVAGHRSTEPGATAALAHLGLDPLVDLGLRLGEGSGAVLALPILEAAANVLAEMATFDGAGVTDKGA